MLAQIWAYLRAGNHLQNAFYLSQIGVGVAFAIILWLSKQREPHSNIRAWESDLKKSKTPKFSKTHQIKREDPLAEARMNVREIPRLSGFSIYGAPHEILGIPKNASEIAIQRAYRELMKRYHPDRVGRQGSREWNDAQKIANAIIQAKEAMLKNQRHKKSS